jgi:hypothetical protein
MQFPEPNKFFLIQALRPGDHLGAGQQLAPAGMAFYYLGPVFVTAPGAIFKFRFKHHCPSSLW